MVVIKFDTSEPFHVSKAGTSSFLVAIRNDLALFHIDM